MAKFKNALVIQNIEEVKMEPVAVDSEEYAREVKSQLPVDQSKARRRNANAIRR